MNGIVDHFKHLSYFISTINTAFSSCGSLRLKRETSRSLLISDSFTAQSACSYLQVALFSHSAPCHENLICGIIILYLKVRALKLETEINITTQVPFRFKMWTDYSAR